MHVSCILKDYHRYNSWYVTTLLLKTYFLFFLHICYILGFFGTTLILHANFIIFQTHLKHINHRHIIKQGRISIGILHPQFQALRSRFNKHSVFEECSYMSQFEATRARYEWVKGTLAL